MEFPCDSQEPVCPFFLDQNLFKDSGSCFTVLNIHHRIYQSTLHKVAIQQIKDGWMDG